jgi:hypothetical protein
MKPQILFGVVLLVVGLGLLIFGMNASHSMADQINNTLTGRFTRATTWYILGGLGVGIAGIYLLLTNVFTKHT